MRHTPIPFRDRLLHISWNVLLVEERDAPLVLHFNRLRSSDPSDDIIFHVPIFMLALGLEVVYIDFTPQKIVQSQSEGLNMQIRTKSVRSITMTGKRVIWGTCV
jgi:hypothetical protein